MPGTLWEQHVPETLRAGLIMGNKILCISLDS